MSIITIKDLSLAIEAVLDIDEGVARKYAAIIMDFFGFEDRIIDNTLEQKERQLFYLLEACGILHTEREKITLQDGRQWRIHYWLLRKNIILKHINNKSRNGKNNGISQSSVETFYSGLPKELWSSRKNTAI